MYLLFWAYPYKISWQIAIIYNEYLKGNFNKANQYLDEIEKEAIDKYKKDFLIDKIINYLGISGQYGKIKQYLQKVSYNKIHSMDINSLYWVFRTYIEDKDFENAYDILSSIKSKYNNEENSIYKLSLLIFLSLTGQIDLFNIVISNYKDINKNYPELENFWRGRAYLAIGENELARQEFKIAITKLNPNQVMQNNAIKEFLLKCREDQSDDSISISNSLIDKSKHILYSNAERKTNTFDEPKVNILSFTYICPAILVVIHLFVIAQGQNGSDIIINLFGNSWLAISLHHEFYRLLTAMFLHDNSSLLHLIFNALGLYILSKMMETKYGAIPLINVFIYSGLIASIGSNITGYYSGIVDYISIGASGGIFGLMGALAYFLYRFSKHLPPHRKQFIMIVLAIMIGYSLFYGIIESRIDNTGHIAGLISGFLIFLLYPYDGKWENVSIVRKIVSYIMVIGIIPMVIYTIISIFNIYKG